MKKTTYITAALTAALAIAAFFLPLALFTKQTPQELFLRLSGQTVALQQDPFFEIKINEKGNPYGGLSLENPEESLNIEIAQDSSISSPVIIMDSEWADNLTISNDSARLTINVDMHKLCASAEADGSGRHNVTVGKGSGRVARVVVPAGMLSYVEPQNFMVRLIDFTDAKLTLHDAWRGFQADNSSFQSLTNF